jgi:hypothetical protein
VSTITIEISGKVVKDDGRKHLKHIAELSWQCCFLKVLFEGWSNIPIFQAVLKRKFILNEKAAKFSLVLKKSHSLDAKGEG